MAFESVSDRMQHMLPYHSTRSRQHTATRPSDGPMMILCGWLGTLRLVLYESTVETLKL